VMAGLPANCYTLLYFFYFYIKFKWVFSIWKSVHALGLIESGQLAQYGFTIRQWF